MGLAAPRVGWGYPRQRCQAWGLGAWRRCRQTLSASSLCRDGAGSTVGEPHSPRTLILPWKSHRSWGPLLHTRSPKRPVQGWGAVQAPTLTLPGCWAGQARGGTVEPKGRAGVLPITAHAGNLSLCRAGCLLLPRAERGNAGLPWKPAPQPSLGIHGGFDHPCPPTCTCPRSRASR